MMLAPANNSPEAEAVSGKQHVGIIGNEGGFILAFSMFMLAICILLGTAAMNTSLYETDISTNEAIAKRTFVLAGSGLPLAAIPILTTGGLGGGDQWAAATEAEPVYLSDTNPLNTADSGLIQILDGKFLEEPMDKDFVHDTGWKNSDKYVNGGTYQSAYKPIDDPFQKNADASIDHIPDVQIRSNQLIIDVDVDFIDKIPLNSAEFGAGAEGTTYKLIYNMNCKATLPSKSLDDSRAPVSEVIIGYRMITGAAGN